MYTHIKYKYYTNIKKLIDESTHNSLKPVTKFILQSNPYLF